MDTAPIELPCYRFYNLVVFYLKEGRSEEQIEALEMDLARLDVVKGPWDNSLLKSNTGTRTRTTAAPSAEKKAIMAAKATMAPSVEEEPAYVPKWWNGDSANYLKARGMMMSPLPNHG